MCPFPDLNLILGNGPLHPVVMLWGLGCLFVQPPAPGTVRECLPGNNEQGPDRNSLSGSGASSPVVLIYGPFPPENVPLSSLEKEMPYNSLVTETFHRELVCLIHQLKLTEKEEEERKYPLILLYYFPGNYPTDVLTHTCSEEYVQDVYCSLLSTSQRMKSKIDHQQET